MNYIHRYETDAQFQAEFYGPNYKEPWVSYTKQTEKVKFNKTKEDLLGTPLTFDIVSGGSLLWKANVSSLTKTIEYSKNDGAWTEITSTTAGTQISVSAGDTVKFRGDNDTYLGVNNGQYCSFGGDASVKFNVSGNIMSLIDSDGFVDLRTFEQPYVFYSLFRQCSGLTDASELMLPATALTNYCYYYMFAACPSLTKGPAELPATTLATGCYWYMFTDCPLLTEAQSELPAPVMVDSCYRAMFTRSGLVNAPEILAESIDGTGYLNVCDGMFEACTSLVKAPSILRPTALCNNAYQYMFYGCSNLQRAPELPAETLITSCYNQMFYNCSKLNYVKCLATDISAANSHNNWLYGVAASGTFVKPASMTGWPSGAAGIPSGWSTQNA